MAYLNFPKVIFGTSSLGNLYTALDDHSKLEIIAESIKHTDGQVIFDSAGKYGAGLALESLGKCLHQLKVDPARIMISNKLGWLRTELTTPEPTFEPGIWKDLKFDAVQRISYDGIMECYEQGNQLLNGYSPQMVSVHDPDEYLANAESEQEEELLYQNIIEAYRALADLKTAGKVKSIGVGAKNWKIIERIAADVALDWVMIANSMTIKCHPDELLNFMKKLAAANISIINSAVFHSGFLIGGAFYDYKPVHPDNDANKELIRWRELFFSLCNSYRVTPAEACVQFALKAPGVKSIALNTSNPERVKENVGMAHSAIPPNFWLDMLEAELISNNCYQQILLEL